MTAIRRFQFYRRLVRVLLVFVAFILPFVRIEGGSAFRFDIPSLTLFVMGSRIAMDEFILVLLTLLFLSFLIILVTILFGRIWCGWLCPQTVISDLTRFTDRIRKFSFPGKIGSAMVVLIFSCLLSADILWYFISPYDFWSELISGKLGSIVGWAWILLTVITFLNFQFLRRKFCATVCPYAKMQGTIYDEQTMIIAMDPDRLDECMDCDACVRACPVDIDVRNGVQIACINCAECIDACGDRMERRAKPSLIGYRYGLGKGTLTFWRKGMLFSAAGSIVFLTLLLYTVFSRTKIEMIVVPDARSMPRVSSDGNLVNVYILTITNRSDVDETLVIQATGGEGELLVIPEKVRVVKNGHERIIVTIKTVKGLPPKHTPQNITISVVSRSDRGVFVQQKVPLFAPW